MQNKKTMNFDTFSGHITVCAQCGYRFVAGDEALRIKETGDIVHRECFMDYNDDNMEELTETIEF